MKRKGLYRLLNDEERCSRLAHPGPGESWTKTVNFGGSLDEPKVRTTKPPKGAKRKAKR